MVNKRNKQTKIKEDIDSQAKNVTTAFECDYCSFQTMDLNVLSGHVANCCSSDQPTAVNSTGLKDDSKFVCPVCNQTFKYETGLKKHKQRHEPPGGFVCSQCNERFLTDADRILHKDTVHKIFKCMICNTKFESEKLFFDHINEIHDGRDREYEICQECGKHFRSLSQLKLHVESKCGTEKMHTCNFCQSKFLSQYTLKTHIQIHVGTKKFLCSTCAASFLSQGQLSIHERSHSKEKPFTCSVKHCKKSFSHRESLVTHLSIHTGIKPYRCECCSSQFSCIGNLIKHRKVRPETCGLPKYSNKKCAPRASTKVSGFSKQQRSTPHSAHEPEFFSVEIIDQSQQSANEETQIINFEQNTIGSGHLNQPLYSTASGEEIILLSENNQFILSHENDNDISVKRDDDDDDDGDGYSSNKMEIIIEGEGGDHIHGENWQFLNAKSENVDDNSKSYSSSNLHNSTMEHDEFDNDCTDLLFDASGDNNETASIHYLKVEPVVDAAVCDAQSNSPGNEGSKNDDHKTLEIFECDLCAKQFNIKKSLAMHFAMVHRPRKEFKCKFCPKTYSNQKLLEKHVIAHGESGNLIVKCVCCREYYATEAEMQKHARAEHEDRLKCFICNRFYKNLDSMDAHLRAMHGDNPKSKTKIKQTYVCATCGRKYYSHRALTDHEQSDCGQRPFYKCEHCERTYHSFGSLKTHQLIHSGDLPFACSFCAKQFRTLGQVKVHQRCHTKEKPFKCNVSECGKSFGHRASLVTHMSLHTGLKRFMCQGCGSRFSCISNLKAHRRTHQETCGQVPLITKAQYGYSLAEMQ